MTEVSTHVVARIRLSSIAVAMLLLYIPSVLFLYGSSAGNHVSGLSVLVAVIMAAILIAGILSASRRFRAIHLMLSYYIACKYLLFPFALLYGEIKPSFYYYLETYRPLTADRVERLLVFGLFSSIAAISGFWLAEALPVSWAFSCKKRFRSIRKDLHRRYGFFVASLLTIALGLYIFSKLGWGSLSGVETVSGDNLWNLANPQIPLYLSMAYIVYGYHTQSRGMRLLLGLTILFVVVEGLLQGSRSAFFVTCMDFCLIYVMVKKDPTVKMRSALKAGILGLFISFGAFAVATSAKDFYRFGFASEDATGLRDQISVGMSRTSLTGAFETFLGRVSDSKAPYYIINDLWVHPPTRYLGATDSAKRTINGLVPGTIFQEDMPPTSLFDWIYFGSVPVYSGETWGLGPACYLYFGYLGGMGVIFIAAWLFGVLYGMLWPRIATYAPMAVVLVVVCFSMVIQQGLVDLWAPAVYQFVVSLVMFVVVWRVASVAGLALRVGTPR